MLPPPPYTWLITMPRVTGAVETILDVLRGIGVAAHSIPSEAAHRISAQTRLERIAKSGWGLIKDPADSDLPCHASNLQLRQEETDGTPMPGCCTTAESGGIARRANDQS